MHYNQYHASLKICFSLGLQNEWIDKETRDKIPYTTSRYWTDKKRVPKNIIGAELEKTIEQNLENIKAQHHPINTVPLALFNAYSQFTVLLVNILDKQVIRKALRNQKESIINFMEENNEYFTFKKVEELLSISSKTLYNWRTSVKYKCEASALLQCVNRQPNQATIKEVKIIQEILQNSDFSHWGIHSCWAYAYRRSLTFLSKSTWSHYNKILGFRVNEIKPKNPKDRESIKSEYVNQIWHADITVFKALNNVKYYIYTVMDNYSRFIHSWRIEKYVSASIRTQTIKEAISNAFGDKPFGDLQLITDGGPENDNYTLKQFISLNHPNIQHDIALKDIKQSNSMMEAFYSTAKWRYLYHKNIQNGDQLQLEVSKMMNEYHYLKPHYALGVYTPFDVLNGVEIKFSRIEINKQAAINRRNENKIAACRVKCE